LRKRRKHGVGVEDSDEESDADDNERARRAMKRARKSYRTDIKGLGSCISYYEFYMQTNFDTSQRRMKRHVPSQIVTIKVCEMTTTILRISQRIRKPCTPRKRLRL